MGLKCCAIRATNKFKEIPVLVVTSSDSPAIEVKWQSSAQAISESQSLIRNS